MTPASGTQPFMETQTILHEGVVIMKRLKSYFRGIFTGFWIGAVFVATVFMSCKDVRDGWNVIAGDKHACIRG